MQKRFLWAGAAIALVAAAAYIIFFYQPNSGSASSAREVKWLLSHQPTDVFDNATRVFADTLKRESGGTLKLVVIQPADVGVDKGDVPHKAVLDALASGVADIASAYTIPLGDNHADFRALNLPFLFASYDEANAALDNAALPILGSLSGDIRGLAFTMSGGFRIIASKTRNFTKTDDLKGARIATSGGPVAEATLKALGAVPVPMDLEHGTERDFSNIDGVETTYARLASALGGASAYTSHVSETNHSVFLTAVIASGAFYDSLTPAEQRALQDAALAAAKVEREDSIQLNASVKDSLKAEGSSVTELSGDVRAALVKATEPVYEEFKSSITPSLYQALIGR